MSANASSATESLSRDHVEVLQNMDTLEQAVAALGANQASEAEWDKVRAVSRFLAPELERHLVQEEEALFPPLEAIIGNTGGPTAVMRAEHVDMRRLNNELAAVAAKPDYPTLKKVAAEMIPLLREHIHKEDVVLFPLCQRILGPAVLANVAQEMQAITGVS